MIRYAAICLAFLAVATTAFGQVYRSDSEEETRSLDNVKITLDPALTGDKNNGVPEELDLARGMTDCNNNGQWDDYDLDNCDGSPWCSDCNGNGLLDECDIAEGIADDCNENGIPDECDPGQCNGSPLCSDCNADGFLDTCDIAAGTGDDCNTNGVLDECETAQGDARWAFTLRSGNGTGSEDSEITMLSGPPDSAFATPFTPQDFESARSGPPALLTSPNAAWLASLPSDPAAKWISTSASGDVEGASALYALDFVLPDGAVPAAAHLEMSFAVDNYLGAAPNQGVYINEQPLSGTTPSGGYSSESSFVRDDVAELLRPGINTLYIYQHDSGGPAGLMFSAVLTLFANDCNESGVPDECDIADGTSGDVDADGIPDECEPVHNVTQNTYHLAIQEAIGDAADYDVIEVSPGTYHELINLLGKAITLRSTDGPAATIIDGDAGGTVITCSSGEGPDTRIDGFTVTNGRADYGGGVHNDGSDPTLIDCVLSENRADERGGGMYNNQSSPTLTNCTFTGNSGSEGGGGMYNNDNSNPMLTHCTFIHNNGNRRGGGGMYNNASHPTLTYCTVSANNSRHGSGMVNSNSNPTLTHCTFVGNHGPEGGGMNNYDSDPTVTNCVFIGNSTGSDGGGAMRNLSSSPTLTNCTFAGNSADTEGGGMYNDAAGATLTNCVFWGNVAPTGAQIHGPATVTYSCIEDTWPGEGNIGWCPPFDPAYRPIAGSPCIDAGSNAAVPADTNDLDGDGDTAEPCPVDLVGAARFVDDPATQDTGHGDPPIVDMGAYEYRTADCNMNGVDDLQDIADGTSNDCNANDFPDECDLANGISIDYDSDGVPDECTDCDGNGISDMCDLSCAIGDCSEYEFCGLIADCNNNGIPDACDVLGGHDCCRDHQAPGCSNPGIRFCVCSSDQYCCQVAWDRLCVEEVMSQGCFDCGTDNDCNANAIPDDCDVITPGDFDADEDGDLDDYTAFADSMAGPGQPPNVPDQECVADYLTAFDIDGDADVDLEDFRLFQQQFTGPQ